MKRLSYLVIYFEQNTSPLHVALLIDKVPAPLDTIAAGDDIACGMFIK